MKPTMKFIFFLMCFCFALSFPAHAITCSILSSSLAFGIYGPLANAHTDKTSLGNVQIHCDGATTVTIRLLNDGNPVLGRTMASARNTLRYELYADAGYHQVLGDGTAGTVSISYRFTAAGTCTIPIYGRILRGQASTRAGVYDADPLLIIDWS